MRKAVEDLTMADVSISSKSSITRTVVWSHDVCTICVVLATVVYIVSTFINVWNAINRAYLWTWSRIVKLLEKRGEREIQVTIHIDSVLASFENFWRLHDRESCTEICSVPVKLCPSPLNSGLQYTWMIPLCFFYKWQLDGCRGGYFENIRQFPKLNKLSISIIVVNYNN